MKKIICIAMSFCLLIPISVDAEEEQNNGCEDVSGFFVCNGNQEEISEETAVKKVEEDEGNGFPDKEKSKKKVKKSKTTEQKNDQIKIREVTKENLSEYHIQIPVTIENVPENTVQQGTEIIVRKEKKILGLADISEMVSTADTMHILFWILMCLLSIFVMLLVFISYKRRKKNRRI